MGDADDHNQLVCAGGDDDEYDDNDIDDYKQDKDDASENYFWQMTKGSTAN